MFNLRLYSDHYDKPPRFLFMETNKRCNLRCNHCDFWTRNDDDRDNYLSHEQKKNILTDLAEMNPLASLVICGGEPMLDVDEYFFMCKTARELGLRVLSVVNGTRIRDVEMAERLMREGPHEISISFDDYREREHDHMRGVKNAWVQSSKAIRLLVAARDRLGAKTKVIVMGLIHAGNYKLLPEFYDFVLNELGADKLKLNMIQPSFGSSSLVAGRDETFVDLSKVDPQLIRNIIEECDKKHGLGINPAWLDNVEMYFESFKDADVSAGWHGNVRTKEAICNSYERNIMIDHYGRAKLCFATAFGMQLVRDPGDLNRFWHSMNDARMKMQGCKIPCGISHSVRRESATVRNPTGV